MRWASRRRRGPRNYRSNSSAPSPIRRLLTDPHAADEVHHPRLANSFQAFGVQDRLDTGDAQLDDDSFFDLYEYRGQPGETIVVTLRSSDFDAFLQGGAPLHFWP